MQRPSRLVGKPALCAPRPAALSQPPANYLVKSGACIARGSPKARKWTSTTGCGAYGCPVEDPSVADELLVAL
jgi:hypothetical protein